MENEQDKSILRGMSFFDGLTEENLAFIQRYMRRRYYEGQSLIYIAGDPVHKVSFLVEGCAKIIVETLNDREILLDICGSGQIIGEPALTDQPRHTLTAQCLEPCVVLQMHRKEFNSCIEAIPRLNRNLLHLYALRLQRYCYRRAVVDGLPISGRIAFTLLWLAKEQGEYMTDGKRSSGGKRMSSREHLFSQERPSQPILLKMHLTQKVIGSLVSGSRESVNKTLALFEREGIIAFDLAQRIIICKPESLKDYCK